MQHILRKIDAAASSPHVDKLVPMLPLLLLTLHHFGEQNVTVVETAFTHLPACACDPRETSRGSKACEEGEHRNLRNQPLEYDDIRLQISLIDLFYRLMKAHRNDDQVAGQACKFLSVVVLDGTQWSLMGPHATSFCRFDCSHRELES